MIEDINELDDLGARMKVAWKKANNYFVLFAEDYRRAKVIIASGRYGHSVNIDQWLTKNVGVFESTVLAKIKAHQRSLAGETREWVLTEEIQNKKQKRLRAEAIKAERIAARAKKQAEKDAKDAEKAALAAKKKRQAKNQKARERYYAKTPRRIRRVTLCSPPRYI